MRLLAASPGATEYDEGFANGVDLYVDLVALAHGPLACARLQLATGGCHEKCLQRQMAVKAHHVLVATGFP